MYLIRKHSSTSNMFRVLLRDSTTGQGLTGLTFSSSGLIISTINDNEATPTAYTAAGATIETVTTLGTFAAPTATKVRFREVDATNHPGLYEVQIADARFAIASAKILRVAFAGATSLLSRGVAVQFDPVPSDVTSIGADVVNASALAADAVAEIADGIWDEATSGHTISGTYGGRIVRATNSNVEVQITGSNHVAADVHEFQAGVITAGDFAANSITASALAADAVTEIQSGLATAANLLIVNDGVGFITSVLLGTISDAGTAGETYVITFGGATYTLDYTGLDATGNRTGVTRTKV